MSSVVRAGTSRISLSNLRPALGSLHDVRRSNFLVVLLHIQHRKNALVEVKGQAMVAHQDAVTRVQRLAQAMENQRLDSRVVKHQ